MDVIFVLFEEVGKEVDWVEELKVVLDVVVDVFPGDEPEPEPELNVVPEFEPDPELVPVPEPKD